MPGIVQRVSYACFARFVVGMTTYALGTVEAYRSGHWHQPYLVADLSIERRFAAGSAVQSRGMELVIADQTLGTYQTLIAAGGLDGTAVTVECVCTVTLSDGTSSEQVVSEVLTVQGARTEPGRSVLVLVDIEDTKLAALYPALQWNAKAFRDMAQADAGAAIARPIGTARKLKAALLSADSTNSYYTYGVCEAPLLTLPITAINTGAQRISVAGDYTDRITAGTVVYSSTSSANAGRFTVASSMFDGSNTRVTMAEPVTSATVSGNLLVPPTVLAVYRDGRVVASTEYTVELLWPVATQQADSDFDNSPADWSASNNGTGTAALTGGLARFTGDGTATNWARLIPADTTVEAQRGAFYAATITLLTAGRLRLFNFSATADGSAVVSGQGTHTAMVRQQAAGGIRRIDVSNYNTGYSGTVDADNIALNTTHRVLLLRFVREQVAFDGSAHTIEVDVRGVESRNAVTEIARLLTAAGCTPDAATFAAAETYANTHRMLVDCDHGSLVSGADGSTGQRRYRAIIDDLLFIARASLYRTSSGTYAIAQDQPGAKAANYNEAESDLIAVRSVVRPPLPQSVAIQYLPNAVDPGMCTQLISRTVTGGVLTPDQPREVRFLSDHEAADRLLCYLALRAEYGRIVKWRQWLTPRALGDVIGLVSPDAGIHSALSVWVRSTQQIPAGTECEGIEYASVVHAYTPDPTPVDAAGLYQPDYSKTPPAAPTALTITAGSVAVATDGGSTARITVTALAPSVNYSGVWFWCVHNTTGEIVGMLRGDVVSGTTYAATLTGLRAGETYQLKSDAENSFGVRGAVQGTFNAAAIGGGGSATTFAAPGYATLPANVSSCTAAQGVARQIQVSWAIVTTANLREYALERKVAAGAFAEIWRGRVMSYIDRDIAIGTAYQYRVRAVDTYGNVSGSYATSGVVTPTSNISGGASFGDIGTGTVETANRTGVSGVAFSFNATDALVMSLGGAVGKTVAHGLGKVPVVGACVYGGAGVLSLTPAGADATNITVVALGHPNTPTASASGAGAHQHSITFGGVSNGDTGTVYVW
jgi:hypothetical protein